VGIGEGDGLGDGEGVGEGEGVGDGDGVGSVFVIVHDELPTVIKTGLQVDVTP
jgi:hypothetical protein